MKAILLVIIFIGGCSMPEVSSMTQEKMENIVVNKVDLIEQQKGYLTFKYNKVNMILISDASHDRMRIIASITEYSKLTDEQKDKVLAANFHKALDARYAVGNGVLYSAFIHPLSSLKQKQIEEALNLVASLALTFGSSYSAGGLTFGGE